MFVGIVEKWEAGPLTDGVSVSKWCDFPLDKDTLVGWHSQSCVKNQTPFRLKLEGTVARLQQMNACLAHGFAL